MINKLLSYLSIISLLVISFGCTPQATPENVSITPSAKNVPKEFAAFSGKWKGTLELDGRGNGDIMLVVDKIDHLKAEIIMSESFFGSDKEYLQVIVNVKPGVLYSAEERHLKSTMAVQLGPTLHYEDNMFRWTFTMHDDLNSITGEIIEISPRPAALSALMHRIK